MEKTTAIKLLQAAHDTAWERYCEIFPILIRRDPPKVTLNPRTYRVAGCNHPWDNRCDYSYKLMVRNSAEMCRVIVPHEIAHQLDYNFNGMPTNGRWHRDSWKTIMIQYGLPPNLYHTLEV